MLSHEERMELVWIILLGGTSHDGKWTFDGLIPWQSEMMEAARDRARNAAENRKMMKRIGWGVAATFLTALSNAIGGWLGHIGWK